MTSRYDPEFDRRAIADGLIDNAGHLYVIGDMEGDWCDCGAPIPSDVDVCDQCRGAA